MPELGHFDAVVTSPPYDGLRDYGDGFDGIDCLAVIRHLARLLKPGGVCAWNVADQMVNGSETGSSFRQALAAIDAGMNLHDTMIYEKAGTGACGSNLAYLQSTEFMFVWSKGRPSAVNRIADHPNVSAGSVRTKGRIAPDGSEKDTKRRVVPLVSVRTNVWRYHAGNNGDDKIKHPARFPEALARDHILSWSNPGDTVLDPFLGSGTTGKMAILEGRRFIGIERDEGYFEVAKQRIEATTNELKELLA